MAENNNGRKPPKRPKKPTAPTSALPPETASTTPEAPEAGEPKKVNLTPEQASALLREIAVADPRYGLHQSGFFRQIHYNPDDLIGRRGLKIYTQMRRDEQIKAALSTKKFATIASGWEIVIDDDNKDRKDLEDMKRFVEFSAREMSGTVEVWLRDAMTALDYGYSISEPTYQLCEYGEWKGFYTWKALKVRRPDQIEFEQDQFGNLSENGVLQGQKRLPAKRFAIYSYRKEFDNLYGTSDLREAYRAWFCKDTLIKYMAMALERYGHPIPVAKTTTTLGDADKALLLSMLQNLQARTALIIPATIELDFHQPDPRAAAQFIPALNKLDEWIAMAILMPNLIGMGGGATEEGSLARSETEFDTFLWVVEQLRAELTEFINDRIIKVLLDLNFNVEDGIYPQFKFRELTHERKLQILDLYNKALAATAVTKTREDEETYRAMAGFPELPEDEVASGTREAQELAMKDQVDMAGKMAKTAPQPGGPAGKSPFGNKPQKSPFGGKDDDEDEDEEKKPAKQKPTNFHLKDTEFDHDQSEHGNRGGGLADVAEKKGGFTYNPVRLKHRGPPRRGYALSVRKDTEKVIDLAAKREAVKAQLKEYVRKHRETIKAEGNYLGGWIDNGKLYLDISKVIKDRNEAVKAAERAEQLAIYDLGEGKTIEIKKAA
jgi:phage gp29-like protein